MQNKVLRIGLAVGIIVLFIGIGIQPTLSNEVTIPAISDSEEDCDCAIPSGKLHFAEKLLNKVETYEGLSIVINSINPKDDSPLCDYIIDKWLYYRDLAVYYWEQALKYPIGSIMFLYYNSLNYVFDYMCMFYYNLGGLFDCEIDPY